MIQTVATWAWANPAYAMGILVGLGLGVFYGLDGWRGDTADIAFSDSPRVKNMLWVLGGGGVAFFSDVKALDPAAARAPLLLAYFASWLVTAVVVVLVVGILVFIAQIVASAKGRNYGYGVAEALGDYFFYGYRHYRKKAEDARENQSTRFHNAYVDQLTLTVGAVGSVNAANQLATARSILGSIAAVVKSYHRDEDDTKGIRANVMLVRNCDDPLRGRLRFAGANAAQVTRCLELVTYDGIENQPGLVLPISNDLNTVLPGAPTAFVHPTRVAVIDDTQQLSYAPGVSDQIRTEIDTYFRARVFRSFGSIQMVGRTGTVGIVNLEATVKQVFGQTEDERRQLIRYLLPFCTALANVYSIP